MRIMFGTRWALVLALLAGCGNGVGGGSLKPLPPSTYRNSDGSTLPVRRDGGRPSDGGGHAIDGGGVQAEVQITILAPVQGTVLKAASSPELRAKVLSLLPVDAGSVGDYLDQVSYALSFVGDKSGKPLVTGPLFGPAANDEWSTRIDLSSLQTGSYLLTVTAVTRNGGVGTASITVLVDAGPILRIVSPRSGGTYKGSVAVQVQIDSTPFAPTKEPVEASIGGYPVTLAVLTTAGLYEGLIEFEKYNPPLVDEQKFTVAAANNLGTRNQAEVKFIVDVVGPVFSDTQPAPGAVIGGVIRVRAKVTDISGVLGPSVIAIIGNKADVNFTLQLEPEAGAPGYYSALFDTAKLTACKLSSTLCIVFPNLSFRASDSLGNESFMAYDIAVDNIPPIFDLDPPRMRLMKFDPSAKSDAGVTADGSVNPGATGMNVCSFAFDPLGDWSRLGDMPNDQCAVPQVFDLRARIEDDGNRAEDLKVIPIAGIDPATTSMYVLDDTAQPLVVDTDGDGYCDGINPLLVPTTSPPKQNNEVLTTRLVPVTPKGTGDFTPDYSLLSDISALRDGCNLGRDTQAPFRLCAVQPSTIAIGYPTAFDPKSAIWTIEPLTAGEHWCMGGQFDALANQINQATVPNPQEGWACVAAAGADRNGNKGVSAPLRVWIQYQGLRQDTVVCPSPPASAGPAPDCTGTYDPKSNQVSSKVCLARRFSSGEIRWQNSSAGAGGN
jgi:hypothetical protein